MFIQLCEMSEENTHKQVKPGYMVRCILFQSRRKQFDTQIIWTHNYLLAWATKQLQYITFFGCVVYST